MALPDLVVADAVFGAEEFVGFTPHFRVVGPGQVPMPGDQFGTLRRIREGVPWQEASATSYGNEGSCGNGAAMRVAPLGAFFAGDPERIATEAMRSAR